MALQPALQLFEAACCVGKASGENALVVKPNAGREAGLRDVDTQGRSVFHGRDIFSGLPREPAALRHYLVDAVFCAYTQSCLIQCGLWLQGQSGRSDLPSESLLRGRLQFTGPLSLRDTPPFDTSLSYKGRLSEASEVT